MPADDMEYLFRSSLEDLKTRIVTGAAQRYSYGWKSDLAEHLAMLRDEFVGRSELEYYHAVLTVFVRREIDPVDTRRRVRALWAQEAAFLVERLDARWLVAACDTFISIGGDDTERALAAAAMLFANTIKLYETERRLTGAADREPSYAPVEGRMALHDGMSAFVVGSGDMVRNLHRRVATLGPDGSPARAILAELLKRASRDDTVYRRFRRVHTNGRTLW